MCNYIKENNTPSNKLNLYTENKMKEIEKDKEMERYFIVMDWKD